MESEQKPAEERGCWCKDRCCCGKAVAALVLLLVGGLAGFFLGGRCGHGACPFAPPAQSQAK